MGKNTALLIALALITVFLASFLAVLPEPYVKAVYSGDDWPMFHHDLAHTGYTSSSAPTSTPTVAWSFNTRSPIRTAPAVSSGYVYVTDDYGLYALDASTGAQLWSTYPSAVYSDPAIADGRVYAQSLAFNASTGDLLWIHPPGDGGSPAVSDGYVYVGVDGVIALNASTGEKIWNYTTGRETRSSPAVAYGQVFIGTGFDGEVVALNASTGAKIWNYTTGYGVNSSPAVAGDVVYIGSDDGNLYALNAFTGTKLWSFRIQPLLDEHGLDRHLYASPAIANGVIYMGSTDGMFFVLGTQEPFPAAWLAVAIIILAVAVVVVFLVYFRKRKHKA